jgi:chemotaxis protein methyltransferase CheR
LGARDDFDAQFAATAANDFAFSPQDFDRVRRMIYARAGISLNDTKRNMVYSRLSRRLRATGIDSFADYLERLEHDRAFGESESQQFINALTTNLTSFFREGHHFPVLAEFLQARLAQAAQDDIRVWCAAASTGEEPWSIAMTMQEALGGRVPARVLATDIDTTVLATAANAVYRLEGTAPCGEARLKRFFLRGTGPNAGFVRVRPELARMVEFKPLNLLDERWPSRPEFSRGVDAVFCRNVMIYFDKPTQRKVLGGIAQVLRRGGLLFAGHSENFSDCRDWFVPRGRTVYERT